jgi:hypothetical protein
MFFSARNGLQSPPQMELQTFAPGSQESGFFCPDYGCVAVNTETDRREPTRKKLHRDGGDCYIDFGWCLVTEVDCGVFHGSIRRGEAIRAISDRAPPFEQYL